MLIAYKTSLYFCYNMAMVLLILFCRKINAESSDFEQYLTISWNLDVLIGNILIFSISISHGIFSITISFNMEVNSNNYFCRPLRKL